MDIKTWVKNDFRLTGMPWISRVYGLNQKYDQYHTCVRHMFKGKKSSTSRRNYHNVNNFLAKKKTTKRFQIFSLRVRRYRKPNETEKTRQNPLKQQPIALVYINKNLFILIYI